jgi:hypothetical protein
MKFAILAATLAAVAATPSPPPSTPSVAAFEAVMEPQASSLGEAATVASAATKYPEKFFPNLPKGTSVKAVTKINKKEVITKKEVTCDCGSADCSCRRRLQETARRLQTTGTKTIEVKTIVFVVEIVFTFTVTAEAVAGGSTAAAVVAAATKAVQTTTESKQDFWESVADVIQDPTIKAELSEAVAEEMTEFAAEEAKITGATPKVYTAADVKTEVKFDEIAETVKSDTFVAAATVEPVVVTVPLATPVPTGAAYHIGGMQIIASLLVAVATCSLM